MEPYVDRNEELTTPKSRLQGLLDRVGLNSSSMQSVKDSLGNVKMGENVNKARDYAAANPGKVLGGLAALVIGAGLMRQRGMR